MSRSLAKHKYCKRLSSWCFLHQEALPAHPACGAGKRTADEEFLQLILDEMRPRLVDAQSKGAAAAQRELNLSTAATMSNALPPPRSAG